MLGLYLGCFLCCTDSPLLLIRNVSKADSITDHVNIHPPLLHVHLVTSLKLNIPDLSPSSTIAVLNYGSQENLTAALLPLHNGIGKIKESSYEENFQVSAFCMVLKKVSVCLMRELPDQLKVDIPTD